MGESVPDVMDVVSFPNTNAARTVTPPPATANERRSANERGSRTLFANAQRERTTLVHRMSLIPGTWLSAHF